MLRPSGITTRSPDRAAWAVLAVAMAIDAALVLWVTRGTTVFVDELDLLAVDRGLQPTALLTPLNGHLVLLQRTLWAVTGPDFVVLRVVEAIGVVAVVGLLFALLRERIGALAALPLAVLVLFLGSAWELNLLISGIGNVLALAFGLGALLVLRRPGPARDAIACALLALSLASFTLGVAVAVGVVVLLALQPGGRRRLWVPLAPLALWALWLVWSRARELGDPADVALGNVLLIPNAVADLAAAAAGALAGLNNDWGTGDLFAEFTTRSDWGPVLAAGAAALLVVRIVRGHAGPWLWAALATLLTFWAVLAMGFGEGRGPSTVRYVYAGGVFLLLLGAEAARGVRPSGRALVVLYAVVALALLGNLGRLRDGATYFRSLAGTVRAQLTALELARDRVDPAFTAAQFPQIVAGPYLAGVDRGRSPAYTEEELARQPEGRRHAADRTLAGALGIGLEPAAVAPERCRRVPGGAPIPVRAPGVVLTAPAPVQAGLRRFADTTTVPVGTAPAGEPVALRVPPDRSGRPWQLSLTPPPATLEVCEPR